jgi:hypothetical protein
MSRRHLQPIEQSNLFYDERKLPEGFAYREDVISAGDEQALIERFQGLPFKPFEFQGFLGKRRVVSFGWRYDFSGATCDRAMTFHHSCFRSANGRQLSRASLPRGCSRSSSTSTRRAPESAGTATSPCSKTWSPYRWARHAVCGCVAGRAAGGSARRRARRPAVVRESASRDRSRATGGDGSGHAGNRLSAIPVLFATQLGRQTGPPRAEP